MNYEVEVIGKEGIVARVVQHSKSAYTKKELITFEIEYPRFILAELNTHCMLEKNSSSSRAVPIKAQCDLIKNNPAMPVHWGKNQSGMVAEQELNEDQQSEVKAIWLEAMESAVGYALKLESKHCHKQLSNRVAEPGQRMKTVISGTEWENFFYLRNHEAAQPEFAELARVMLEAKNKSTPLEIVADEWHVPYVERKFIGGVLRYFSCNQELTLEEARMVSASCCAQTSYRKSDESLEKAKQVFERLNIGSPDQPAHASPTTHQGTPIFYSKLSTIEFPETWCEGITHMTANSKLWSGKFQDFIQFRKLIPNEAKW
jgi:thymidylate synthase ThyX